MYKNTNPFPSYKNKNKFLNKSEIQETAIYLPANPKIPIVKSLNTPPPLYRSTSSPHLPFILFWGSLPW